MKTYKYIACFGLALMTVPKASHADIPLAKDNLEYIGAFRVPHGSHNGTSFSNNSDVNAQYQPMAYDQRGDALFLGQTTGVQTDPKRIGKITIPEIINPLEVGEQLSLLKTAGVIYDPQDISSGKFDLIKENGSSPADEAKAQLGGLYVLGGKLYGTAWSYYDGSGNNGYRSHWVANSDWSQGYDFNGIYSVGQSPKGFGANGGFIGGYISDVPSKYVEAIGGTMISGRTGGPIVSRSSYGPALFSYDPNITLPNQHIAATNLISYTENNKTLGDYGDLISEKFNRSTGVRGVVWPERYSSILFFGQHGLGIEFDSNGIPKDNTTPSCNGYGTPNKDEVRNNSFFKSSNISKWQCGYKKMTASDIDNGASCCYDIEKSGLGDHWQPYVIGKGASCYGVGTSNYKLARNNDWLKVHSSSGYSCGETSLSASDIAAGNACCFVGSGQTSKGGSSFPSRYQVWQYEVEDLIEVKKGELSPWEIVPKVWSFNLPFDNPKKNKQIMSTAYDRANNRLFIGQAFGDGNYPLIHVFSFDKAAAKPPHNFSGN